MKHISLIKKSIIVFPLIFITILFINYTDTASPAPSDINLASPAAKPIVIQLYRTKSGECYHTDGCFYLKSKIPVTQEQIDKMKLRPCSVCVKQKTSDIAD